MNKYNEEMGGLHGPGNPLLPSNPSCRCKKKRIELITRRREPINVPAGAHTNFLINFLKDHHHPPTTATVTTTTTKTTGHRHNNHRQKPPATAIPLPNPNPNPEEEEEEISRRKHTTTTTTTTARMYVCARSNFHPTLNFQFLHAVAFGSWRRPRFILCTCVFSASGTQDIERCCQECWRRYHRGCRSY